MDDDQDGSSCVPASISEIPFEHVGSTVATKPVGFSGGGCGAQCHRVVLDPGDPREQVVRQTGWSRRSVDLLGTS